MYVIGWETRAFPVSIYRRIGGNNPVTRTSCSEFKMASPKRGRVKRSHMSNIATVYDFFANKSSVPTTALNSPRQILCCSGVPHPLLQWGRSIMSICLSLVAETLRHCRQPLAHFAVTRVRPRSTSSAK